MLEKVLSFIVDFVENLGYLGIFIMTFIEGTFVPIPSEFTIIPAGYLVAKGQFQMHIVLFCSILGTLCGALSNYFIAYHYGRIFVQKFGKYIFFGEDKLKYMENYFYKHGTISVFIGRMLPGLKHFISFPAGLAKMNVKLFCIYSSLGATSWVLILFFLGYFIGNNDLELKKYITHINYILLILLSLLVTIYVIKYKNKKKSINDIDTDVNTNIKNIDKNNTNKKSNE